MTLASLKANARYGGIVLDLDNIALQTTGSTNPADYAIDRVVFDPPEVFDPLEEWNEPVRLTRLANIAWRTMASAQGGFENPYRLVVVGSLAPSFDSTVQGSNFGAIALRAMWPSTDYRYRMNSERVIAGTYYRAPQNGLGGGLRAAIWHWSTAVSQWVRTDLEEAPQDPRTDTIACAITDPYVDERGDWVIMVGGARTERCTGTPSDADTTCGKPHAAAWCVKLGAYAGTGPLTPVSVVAVPVATDCDGSVVDESVVRDLKVVPNESGPGSYTLGCGAVGMWCGFDPASLAYRPARTHAAAFPIRVSGESAYAGTARVIHYGRPLECQPVEATGPLENDEWSLSLANGWVRGEPGAWDHSMVGAWEGDLTCMVDVQAACDRYSSAMQWDWTSWDWTSGQPHDAEENAYPWLRAAPPGTRRPETLALEGEDNGGKVDPPPAPPAAPQQVFSASAATRRSLALGGSSPTQVVTSVGWLVDGCFDLTQCGCDSKAAVFEYPDAVGSGCWSTDPSPVGGKPWITQDSPSSGCIRALNLHAVAWSSGEPADSPLLRPFSKAGAVVAVAGGEAEHRRLVLGAVFDAEGSSIDFDLLRGILWRGSSASLAPTPHVPDSEWCGAPLERLARTVQSPGEPVVTWDALSQVVYELYPDFEPSVLTGQDIGASARIACVARLRPTSAYQVCLLVPRADFTGDGVVSGSDLGMLLASWGQPHIDCDLDGSGTVSGADLGALLAMWGAASVDFACGPHALSSNDIEVVLLAAQATGFEDFDELQFGMSLMPPAQAEYLAEFISMCADAIREGGAP